MASLCILHNNPTGVRGAFAAVATPHREASDLPGDRRTKIWELSGSLHCSIIGT
jgi:hypothetical protein